MKKTILYIILIIATSLALFSQSKIVYDNDSLKLKKAVQCTALTQNGIRCKNITRNNSGLCWWHYKGNYKKTVKFKKKKIKQKFENLRKK